MPSKYNLNELVPITVISYEFYGGKWMPRQILYRYGYRRGEGDAK